MADLTDEMKGFLNSNLAWVATISKEGQVDLGPKMSMFIIDNNHIGYHERTAGQTYRNLLDGSDLVVAVANLEQKKGYRFRAYRNFCGALDWFSLSVGGVGVSRGGVEFVPVDAGPVCGRDAVVRFGRRCLFALPQGVGDE